MNIDERLDRLTTRHDALTESIEMLTADLPEMRAQFHDQFKEVHERRYRAGPAMDKEKTLNAAADTTASARPISKTQRGDHNL